MLSGAVPWNENVSLPWQRGGHPLAADSGYQVAAADLCQLPPQCQQGLKQLQKAQVEARACSNNGLAVWEGAMSCTGTLSQHLWCVLDDDLQLPRHLAGHILKFSLRSGLCRVAAHPSRRAPSRDEAPGIASLLISSNLRQLSNFAISAIVNLATR